MFQDVHADTKHHEVPVKPVERSSSNVCVHCQAHHDQRKGLPSNEPTHPRQRQAERHDIPEPRESAHDETERQHDVVVAPLVAIPLWCARAAGSMWAATGNARAGIVHSEQRAGPNFACIVDTGEERRSLGEVAPFSGHLCVPLCDGGAGGCSGGALRRQQAALHGLLNEHLHVRVRVVGIACCPCERAFVGAALAIVYTSVLHKLTIVTFLKGARGLGWS